MSPGIPPASDFERRWNPGFGNVHETPGHPAYHDTMRRLGPRPPYWREAFEERAGILEFSANLPRFEAETKAWAMTIEALGAPPEGLTLEGCRRSRGP